MKTHRLYYTDPYLREFDANLVETVSHEGKTALVLDRTAFYPTSGGQPYDVGFFHDVRVLDVVDADDERVLHIVDRAPSTTTLHGVIDWPRRFDHMQQHTGQHVLSAAFDRVLGARTESFHLGVESSTIDLNRELTAGEIARAEDEANRIVWEDREVGIKFVDASEAATLGLRKDSKREGTLRLIDVADFDLSACGGTHVARTGAIGIIAVSATERFRGGSRITFLCGGRALAGYRALREVVDQSGRSLSVGATELAAAVERLQSESKDLRKQIKDFQGKLASHEADALADAAAAVGSARLVSAVLAGWDANGLKVIAARIAERPGHAAVLVGGLPASPIVVARAQDVAFDSGALLKTLVERHGGKGGGRPELAQGGGIAAPSAEVLQSARTLIAQLLKQPLG
ncbi:MAG TPA: DHHA1 domain-containing protein [Vicinamibacterales bacterium]|jgi:alanyl-tRNA synthetase|nr:DHHA1 domain-containing protein [Vicinamibacterales bacterium]